MLDIFWICLICLSHTYLFFPLTLPLLAELLGTRRTQNSLEKLPRVSILISAFNEASIIEEKIRNCLALDYPEELLEILIGDDGSKDETASIVKRYAPRVTLVHTPVNQGKAAMLNRLFETAQGEILLFCDANTMFFPNVILKIVQPFAHARIGCVCGHLILNDQSGSALGEGETTYWDLESEIKKFEGSLAIVIGGNGALYAIRRELFTKLPVKRSIMDDFYVTTKVLHKGYLSTYLSSAVGTEQTSKSGMGEFRRKVRIGRANFNYLPHYLLMLFPLRPLVAYLFLSHKLLRWFSPHLLLGLFFSNIFVLQQGSFYLLAFIGQFVFYGLAILGALQQSRGVKHRLTSIPFYFLTMNYALFLGFCQSFLPEKGGGWKREARGGEKANVAE